MSIVAATVLAIDIGGTKLAAGIVDTDGRILSRGDPSATEQESSNCLQT